MIGISLRPTLLGFCLSACLLAQPALAAPTSLAESLRGEAKSAYESGRLLFEDGDSRGALAKFSHAYDLSREPRLLWNMAACEKELRHYARAATLIGRYLREGAGSIPADLRQDALDTQRALRAFYVELKLSGAPPGSTVLVDGVKVGQIPLAEPLLVDLGTRSVRVERPGFEASETSLEVAGGGELTLDVKLKASPVGSAARLSIASSGEHDRVVLDGKLVGWQRWEGMVAVGEHIVRVSAAHKKPYEAHVQLLAGSTRSLQITLEDEGHASKLWLWVAGGVAVAAGAAVGGYFLFKPQEAPGSHPEGNLATIFLPPKGMQ
jgi:hypothetical protein